MKGGERTTGEAGERNVALISNPAQCFEFAKGVLACLILLSEVVSVESFSRHARGELLRAKAVR